MMLPLIVGFFTIVLVLIALTLIAHMTGVAVIDLMFGAFFLVIAIMALMGASIEVGKLILGACNG